MLFGKTLDLSSKEEQGILGCSRSLVWKPEAVMVRGSGTGTV